MNNESKLLGKVIQDKSLGYILERNINESWFKDPSEKQLFKFLHSHYAKYAECPSLDVISENFPSYQIVKSEDNIDYLLDRIVDERRKAIVVSTLGSAIEAVEKNKEHDTALDLFARGILRVEEEGLSRTNDLELTKEASKAKTEYEHRKNNPGLLGYPTGFPTMDQATSGMQKGQLIVVVAPPKTGKSTLALQMALTTHMADIRPLFISFEMSNEEQKTRYYAMKARVSHKRLMTGSLTAEEEQRYYKIAEGIEKMNEKFYFSDAANGLTVSSIASKIQTLKPQIVFIDGTYLMIDEEGGDPGSPQSFTNITRSLKRLAQKAKVPIVTTTQVLTWKMRKGQVTADAIGYSSSFHQDADVIFGLQREDESVDDTRSLKVIASRNGGFVETALIWNWETGDFREVSDEDL